MTLRIRNVQVDAPAERYDATVAFWAAALGATPRPAGGPFTHLLGVPGTVGLHLQRLESGPAGYHLDLETDDPDAEVIRLLDLGASRGPLVEAGPPVLRDPAGLAFCVGRIGAAEAERLQPPAPGRGFLELVVLDLPSDRCDEAIAFWSAALGTSVQPLPPPADSYTMLRGSRGPSGGGVDLLVQDVGDTAPRLHVDLHVAGAAARDGEVARLQALGAAPVAATDRWQVLADPSGHLLCVVPQ